MVQMPRLRDVSIARMVRSLGLPTTWNPTLVAKMPRSKWYLMASASVSARYYAKLNASS
jgi:hypothetical protein